jgi:DNA-binding Lrp family transcriptional regulator
MAKNIIHAIIFIQNWGENRDILQVLRNNPHIISLFHIMGRHSYLIDANFDDKGQLEEWIARIKAVKLPAGIPAIIAIQTQKIINVHKQKEGFDLKNYQGLKDQFHFFVKIDNPHDDQKLITLLKKNEIVHSILHVQGDCSFIVEVITGSYDKYRQLLGKMKSLPSIHHIETQEVISVIKYRNQVLDESGNMIYPEEDLRELYTL